jgi:hypothetical protein
MCSLSVRVIAGYDWFFVLYLYLIHTILNMFPVAFLAYYQFGKMKDNLSKDLVIVVNLKRK